MDPRNQDFIQDPPAERVDVVFSPHSVVASNNGVFPFYGSLCLVVVTNAVLMKSWDLILMTFHTTAKRKS